MKPRIVYVVLSIVLLAVVAALSACSVQPVQPAAPEIHFGEDLCSDCGMIINDPRFAAAYAVEREQGAYETFVFDDIGDMVKHMRGNPALVGTGWWVHDYHSEEWIDAETAWFVASAEIKSPMNHGLAAFGTQDAAETMAAEAGGEVLDWAGLRVHAAMASHQH